MAVVAYWLQRLRDRRPLWSPGLNLPGQTFRPFRDRPEDSWPQAVSKQALFQDYQLWFTDVYLPPFQASGFYQDVPEALPKPATDLDFFVIMSPMIHLVGRAQQTRSHIVPLREMHQGEWYTVKRRKNFVRLCSWQEHVAAFELQTGLPVAATLPPPTEQMKTVARGVKVSIRKLADNKAVLERAIGRAARG
jgi:hypothetical protein